jgi:glycosyltransferase involved in cell wall biosynthesis
MKRRIAYVAPGYPPSLGGVETHVRELARRVASAGWSVDVLTTDASADSEAIEMVDGVVVRRFENRSPANRYQLAPALVRFLFRHGRRYDVVHAQNYHALASLTATLARCHRLVFTPHYLGVGETAATRTLHTLYHPLGSIIFARAARVVCVTRTEAHEVQRRFPGTQGRTVVIPNGIDVVAIRAAVPAAAGGTIVLSAGRLERYKSVDRAIRAVAHLPADVSLYIAGDGPARPHLAAVAAAARVEGRVNFLGRLDVKTLYRWYRAASVYVTMSQRECFGITLLEAAAAGAGLVAADTRVHRDVLRTVGAEEASLVPADAGAESVAAAIARQSALQHVPRQPATWDDVAEKTLEVYGEVLREVTAA